MWNITVDEALARVTAGIASLPAEPVALAEAGGRVLAEDIISPIDLPPFANSAMDGYAVAAADIASATAEAPVRLAVTGRVAAGHLPSGGVRRGQAARIMTGAPIPLGADAVVKFEDTQMPHEGAIDILVAMPPGGNIRQPGEDIVAGRVALGAGTVLGPAALGLLAALGRAVIPCVRRPRVAVIATGDEIVPPGQPLPPGGIYDSNSTMLAALVRQYGGALGFVGTARDEAAAHRAALDRALASAPDLILTSGGVAQGDFDLVKDILQAAGEMDFWQVRMRPGKPLAFGHVAGVPLLGLAGNPVAAFVGATIFARAVLLALQGRDPQPALHEAVCGAAIRNGSGRRNFLRGHATLEGTRLVVRPSAGQLPTQLAPLAHGNCLIVAHEDHPLYALGETIPIILLSSAFA
jgi:molybdopterin molybdotransferase